MNRTVSALGKPEYRRRKAGKKVEVRQRKKRVRPEDCREPKEKPKKKLRSYNGNFEKNFPEKLPFSRRKFNVAVNFRQFTVVSRPGQ